LAFRAGSGPKEAPFRPAEEAPFMAPLRRVLRLESRRLTIIRVPFVDIRVKEHRKAEWKVLDRFIFACKIRQLADFREKREKAGRLAQKTGNPASSVY
jgi:hypothetical protein